MRALRHAVPVGVRRAASAGLAAFESRRTDRELAALAASGRPIVAGPWLGEVGYELLYWVPFLAWCSERFSIDPARLLVVSRGGTASWYAPFVSHYRDALDYVTPEEFHARHEARVHELGEQKQTRVTTFDRELFERAAADAGVSGAALLHPSTMYRVLRPFWWGHQGESWVHRHTRYRRLVPPSEVQGLPASYTAVKFYFNDCFPPTDANRAFARAVVEALAREDAVVSLSSGVTLDTHGECAVPMTGVIELAGGASPSRNLEIQSAVVAGARRFVGTYGGFAYLAPFYGVPATTYYSEADGFAPSHLHMARSALAVMGIPGLLHVHPVSQGGPHRREQQHT